MMQKNIRISCPKCEWKPDGGSYWQCSICKTKWNTFETRAHCPGCGKVYDVTVCPKSRGGCGELSPHDDWYEEVEKPKNEFSFKSIFSSGKSSQPPVTANDKKWVEQSLLFLAEIFEPIYFKSLETITPDKEYFDRNFTGTEEDAEDILER